MYAYIAGKLTEKNISNVVIDVNGLGYKIEVSLNTFSQIEKETSAKLHIYFHVREDAQILYGFAELAEKDLFEKLISISGIGTNTARMMLSAFPPRDIEIAIVEENLALIKSIKGIGEKTAKRVILELKDKVKISSSENGINSSISNNSNREQALSALLSLGFSKPASEKALNKVVKQETTEVSVEDLIKKSLKIL